MKSFFSDDAQGIEFFLRKRSFYFNVASVGEKAQEIHCPEAIIIEKRWYFLSVVLQPYR